MNHAGSGKRYIHFLPEVFHGEGEEDPFIVRYLSIFEKILSGIDDGELEGKKGILETLDIISDIVHPRFSFLFDETEKRFLPPVTTDEETLLKKYFRPTDVDAGVFLDDFFRWLAGWMALVLRDDWEIEKKREVIARILPLYRMRGTKRGLEEYLKIYVGRPVTIIDEVEPFRIGVDSAIGKSARIGGLISHVFIVEVDVLYMFSWDNVPGSESKRLLSYLTEEFGIDWAEGAEIRKSDDGRAIHIFTAENSAEIVMEARMEKGTLAILGGKTYNLNVKTEQGKHTIYSAKDIDADDIRLWGQKKKAIEALINSEKPAHTDYWLNIKYPRTTVGVNSKVGKNTVL